MSRRNSLVVQRGLGLLTLIFLVLALERFVNAAMAGSEIGSRTAWMLGWAFALTGTTLFGLLLFIGGAGRTDRVDAGADCSHRGQER